MQSSLRPVREAVAQDLRPREVLHQSKPAKQPPREQQVTQGGSREEGYADREVLWRDKVTLLDIKAKTGHPERAEAQDSQLHS